MYKMKNSVIGERYGVIDDVLTDTEKRDTETDILRERTIDARLSCF